MMIKEGDHLIGIWDAGEEVLKLPHFDLTDPVTPENIKFVLMHLYKIKAEMIMKLRTSIEGSLVMYIVISGSTVDFESFSNFDQLTFIPVNDYHKLTNLADETRMMLESFDEYSHLDPGDPASDFETEEDY